MRTHRHTLAHPVETLNVRIPLRRDIQDRRNRAEPRRAKPRRGAHGGGRAVGWSYGKLAVQMVVRGSRLGQARGISVSRFGFICLDPINFRREGGWRGRAGFGINSPRFTGRLRGKTTTTPCIGQSSVVADRRCKGMSPHDQALPRIAETPGQPQQAYLAALILSWLGLARLALIWFLLAWLVHLTKRGQVGR